MQLGTQGDAQKCPNSWFATGFYMKYYRLLGLERRMFYLFATKFHLISI